MTPAFQHYEAICALGEGSFVRLIRDTPNTYNFQGKSTLPEGTVVRIEFTSRDCFYGRADIEGGRTLKCKVDADDFHRVEVMEAQPKKPPAEPKVGATGMFRTGWMV